MVLLRVGGILAVQPVQDKLRPGQPLILRVCLFKDKVRRGLVAVIEAHPCGAPAGDQAGSGCSLHRAFPGASGNVASLRKASPGASGNAAFLRRASPGASGSGRLIRRGHSLLKAGGVAFRRLLCDGVAAARVKPA